MNFTLRQQDIQNLNFHQQGLSASTQAEIVQQNQQQLNDDLDNRFNHIAAPNNHNPHHILIRPLPENNPANPQQNVQQQMTGWAGARADINPNQFLIGQNPNPTVPDLTNNLNNAWIQQINPNQ